MKTLKELFLENVKECYKGEPKENILARTAYYTIILQEELDKYKETNINILSFLYKNGENYEHDECILWTHTRIYMLNYDDGIEYVMSVPRNPSLMTTECFR